MTRACVGKPGESFRGLSSADPSAVQPNCVFEFAPFEAVVPPSRGEARGKLQPACLGQALKRLYGALLVTEFEIGFTEVFQRAPR